MERILSSHSTSRAPLFRTVERLGALLALGRSRRRLSQLDERLLRDIGLTESEARREAEMPFWNAPDHWLR